MIDDKTFVIANTDLLHCGNNYNTECPNDIENYNTKTINMIKNNDFDFDHNQMCGISAIKTFMAIAKNKNWICNKHYYTSSDRIHPSESSVGYVGMVFMNIHKNIQKGGLHKEIKLLEIPRILINQDYVKSILGQHINDQKITEILNIFSNKYTLPKTQKPYGIFVTIKNKGNLRGCIGDFNVTYDVGRLIAKQTLESLFYDSRFYHDMVKEDEINDLTFDINFLGERRTIYTFDSNIKPIDALLKSNFKIGEKEGHGIIIHFTDGRRATYLSSVLPELGIHEINDNTWNKLVNSLKNKAGLMTNDMTNDIEKIEIYYCQEYREGDNQVINGGSSLNAKNKYIYNKNSYRTICNII